MASIGYLGGTLSQPKIVLDPKDIAIKYGKYTAAIFTGGLSLLADQLWRNAKQTRMFALRSWKACQSKTNAYGLNAILKISKKQQIKRCDTD